MQSPRGGAAAADGGSGSPRRLGRALLLLIVPPLAFAALYQRALDYDFVWTDTTAIAQGTMLRPADELLSAFAEPLHRIAVRGDQVVQSYYRPLPVVLLSAVDSALGRVPRYFRVATLAVGALATALLGLFAWMLLGRVGPALFAALAVAVHPAGIETTVWIAAVSAPMCGVFLLATLALALASRSSQRRGRRIVLGALSVLALFAALLSKERAVVEPGLLLAAFASLAHREGLDLRRPRTALADPRWRAAAALLGVHGLAVAAYVFAWRPLVVGFAASGAPLIGGSAKTQILTALATWPQSLAWIFVPLESSTSDVVRVVTSAWDPMAWLGMLLALGSLATWLLLLRAGRPVAAFGLAWIWIAFLPTSGLLPMPHARAERYLYLSTFGAALAVADLAPALLRWAAPGLRRWLVPALAACAVAFLAQRTWTRLPDWQSTVALFEGEVRRDPRYREAHFLLAVEYSSQGRYLEADAHLRTLRHRSASFAGTSSYLQWLPVYETACVNELALRRYEGVLRLEEEARGKRPGLFRSPTLRTCVGQAKEGLGQVQAALDTYRGVVDELGAETPPRLYLLLVRANQKLKRFDEAFEWLERAEAAAAGDPEIQREVLQLRWQLKRRS